MASSFDSNAPLELANLRERRLREMRRSLELAARSPRTFGTGATLSGVRDLEDDINSDPDTGIDAATRVAQIQRQNNELMDYNRPDQMTVRNTERDYEIRKLTEPTRLAGETQRDVARINAAGHVAGARETAQGKATQYVQVLNPETGMTEWREKGPGLAGMLGPSTGEERGRIKGGQAALDLIGEVNQAGENAGWKGIGLTGPAQSALYRYLGLGNDKEENLRSMMSRLQAEIGFGTGGKALTGTELEMIRKYTADTGMNPAAAKARLGAVETMIRTRLLRDQGQNPDLITDPNWGASSGRPE